MGIGSELKIEVPEAVIKSIVQAQVVAALGKSEQLIEGVVRAALEQKKNSYDRTTVFEEQVSEMIRGVALEAFKEFLVESKERIRAELKKQLAAQKGKVITDLVDGFTRDIANIYPTVTLKFGGDR